MMLLVIIYIFLDKFFWKARHNFFKKFGLIGEGSKLLNEDVDEGLSSYWKAISGIEQKIWYTTEVYNRANLNIKSLSNVQMEDLRTHKREKNKKYIKGCANYKILFNKSYQ